MAATSDTVLAGATRPASAVSVTAESAAPAVVVETRPESVVGGGSGAGRGGVRGGGGGEPPSPRGVVWRRRAGSVLPNALRGLAGVPLAVLVALVGILVWKALPAIRYNGFGFFTHTTWDLGSFYSPVVTGHGVAHPPGAAYGALTLIV